MPGFFLVKSGKEKLIKEQLEKLLSKTRSNMSKEVLESII